MKKLLNEISFDSIKKELGEINFSKTKIDDEHIKKAIAHIAESAGVSEEAVLDEIHKNIAEFQPIAAKAPILYATINNNIVEDEVFTLMQKAEKNVKGAPQFSFPIFMDVVHRVEAEHARSLFPMRNYVDMKRVTPNILVTPGANEAVNKRYANVKTAAATKTGDFIFYKPFMQTLLDFAHLKGVKPKGKKYKSNGGKIPDEYTYLEFLILHEFMHYRHADFHNMDVYKLDPKIVNWVGDFRSNYMLVKSGHDQLPMGLFNDHINLDRQRTFREMYDIVKAEFDKLNENQQKQVSDKLDEMTDQHNQEETEPGQQKPSEADAEKANQSVKSDVEGKTDKDAEPEPQEKLGNGKGNAKKGSRSDSSSNPDTSAFDYSKVKPTYSWENLLRKMVSSQSTDSYETYQKPNRRSITSVEIGRQIGAAAVKPGEVLKESDLKINFVIDSSGSMSDVIPQVYSNIVSLLKTSRDISPTFWLMKFSNTHVKYLCNMKSQSYAEIKTIGDSEKAKKGDLRHLFTEHFGAGTNFNQSLVDDVETLTKKKFNTCLFLDSDILYGENFTNFAAMYNANRTQIFAIFDSRETFVQVCSQLKQVPKTFSYFSK